MFDRVESAFDSMVEAVRVGTIFAYENDEYRKWRAGKDVPNAMNDAALEQAILALGKQYPGAVERVAA